MSIPKIYSKLIKRAPGYCIEEVFEVYGIIYTENNDGVEGVGEGGGGGGWGCVYMQQ